MSNLIATNALTMSSFEIAKLVNKRHDNVKRTIETLANNNVIQLPQIEDCGRINGLGLRQSLDAYIFSGEQGKRDSIVVVAQLSPEFTARLVDRWQELEKNINYKSKLKQEDTGLSQFRKARSIKIATDSFKDICSIFPNLSEQSKQVICANLINPIAGAEVIPLPTLEQKHYTAAEVGEQLGLSANKVGRIANELGLKTAENGISVLDKSKYSAKQVEAFRYNAKAIEAIRSHLTKEAV